MRTKYSLTLLEVVLVVAIIAITAGAMTPMFSLLRHRVQLRSDLESLLFNIKQTQQMAMVRDSGYQYYGLRFYDNLGPGNDETGYKILRYEPIDVVPPIPNAAGTPFTVVKSSRLGDNPLIFDEHMVFSGGVAFYPAAEIGTTVPRRIIFTSMGSATTDGQTLLPNNGDEIILSCSRYSGRIVMSPLTGHAEIN